MKTSEEVIANLFQRREEYYRQRKRNAYRIITCSLLIIGISLFMLNHSQNNISLDLNNQNNTYVTRPSPYIQSLSDDNIESMADKILINVLQVVPLIVQDEAEAGEFQNMSRDEILSYFDVDLNIYDALPNNQMVEETQIYGFYANEYGHIYPKESFVFRNTEENQYMRIDLQINTIPQVVLCNTIENDPVHSVINGTEVFIYQWNDMNQDNYYCTLCVGNTGISIKTTNMNQETVISIIEYFAGQNFRIVDVEPITRNVE